MSEQDSFITEVSEEVRRDRLYRLFRRYGWIGAVLVVVIVGGAAWNEWRKAQNEASAQAAGDAILAALEGDLDARQSVLAGIDASDNAAQGAVLSLLQADAALSLGNREDAISILEAIENAADIPDAYRELATIKSVILAGSDIPAEERVGRLNALALGGGAFRLLASEQIALAEVELGQTEAAIQRLRDINGDAATTQDLRRRASQLIVALGGTLTTQ